MLGLVVDDFPNILPPGKNNCDKFENLCSARHHRFHQTRRQASGSHTLLHQAFGNEKSGQLILQLYYYVENWTSGSFRLKNIKCKDRGTSERSADFKFIRLMDWKSASTTPLLAVVQPALRPTSSTNASYVSSLEPRSSNGET
eukprot:scaffold2299_cov131-Cylindrotheca_fusiformis.AAC.41